MTESELGDRIELLLRAARELEVMQAGELAVRLARLQPILAVWLHREAAVAAMEWARLRAESDLPPELAETCALDTVGAMVALNAANAVLGTE